MSAEGFDCRISDRDYLAAFAPAQPDEVKAGQRWTCASDGAELPVKGVRGGMVELGGDYYTVILPEATLREQWVCTSAPENVTKIQRG